MQRDSLRHAGTPPAVLFSIGALLQPLIEDRVVGWANNRVDTIATVLAAVLGEQYAFLIGLAALMLAWGMSRANKLERQQIRWRSTLDGIQNCVVVLRQNLQDYLLYGDGTNSGVQDEHLDVRMVFELSKLRGYLSHVARGLRGYGRLAKLAIMGDENPLLNYRQMDEDLMEIEQFLGQARARLYLFLPRP